MIFHLFLDIFIHLVIMPIPRSLFWNLSLLFLGLGEDVERMQRNTLSFPIVLLPELSPSLYVVASNFSPMLKLLGDDIHHYYDKHYNSMSVVFAMSHVC